MSHYQKVCEFGKVHGQCRCPGPKKTINVVCGIPNQHSPDFAKVIPLKPTPSYVPDEDEHFTETDLSVRLDNLLNRELWWMKEHLRDDLVTKIMAEVTN